MIRIVVLGALAACSTGTPGPSIDLDRAMLVTELLAKSPRAGDSAQSRAAIETIARQLDTSSPEVLEVGPIDLPQITVLGTTYREARRLQTTDPDLIVRFGPRGKALLVMAHYDTVDGSPGAVDNGAAVAVLIGIAHVLVAHPPKQPVILAFTANEEIGLVGAEALAERYGGEIEFAISLDMIGGSGRLTLNGASKLIGSSEMHWLADAADRAGIELSAPLAHRVISRWWPQAERSDHGAFTRRGIRAVHLYNRGQDGEWIDTAYHSGRDVFARVDRHSLDECARLLLALFDEPPPAHGSDGFWLPIVTNVVVPRWMLIAFELALAMTALAALVTMLLRRGHERARGLGLIAGIACYAAAVGVALAIERLTHVAWAAAPLIPELALVLVLAGTFGLTIRLASRFVPWTGADRYRAVALVITLAIGVGLIAIHAAELAWIWLVPAALIAVAPRLGPGSPLAPLAAILPGALVLRPNQLREAMFNGFFPSEIPLSPMLGLFGICIVATTAWYLRRRQLGPLGSLVLTMGCGLAVISGVLLLL